ncbi:MAG: DUF2059 domain-containing protein [Burkholderiales bacterium]|nr:DUF2059 domain-containing protein [Burkholderiales bacterium]
MKLLPVFATVVALAFGAAVHADELTAAKRANIKTLLDLVNIKAIPEQIANNTVQSWVPGVRQLDPKFPDKGFTLARDAMLAALNAKADAAGGLTEQVTLVYHNAFTGPEVAELVKFYQSPIGKKLLANQPKVNAETFQTAMKWADSLSSEIDQRVDAALKKEGLKLPEPPKTASGAAPAPSAAQPPAKK